MASHHHFPFIASRTLARWAAALLAALWLLPGGAAAQEAAYWVAFTDKPALAPLVCISPEAVRNRLAQGLPVCQPTDLPVHAAYLAQVRAAGVQVRAVSKWLNAVSVQADARQIARVRRLPFVREVTPLDVRLKLTASAAGRPPQTGLPGGRTYSTALTQIGAQALADAGLSGKGVKVGIVDVGFYGVPTNAALQHIRAENRIKDTRDYVSPGRAGSFFAMETYSDYHGSEVLQLIGGYNDLQKMAFGAAPDATFYLARTDHGVRETRAEEDNWIAAIERLDSLGVRLVNTSLGYALGFSNPKENYVPADMDGKTSKISRAAQLAADQKGMLLVVSAGNEGDDQKWRIISTPADARGVLSVGATKAKSRDRISYSSIGPEALPYLKPNVSCFSPNGTSFSAPVITGLAACLMEKNPKLSGAQLLRIIERSAHLYPYGNNFIGYGVPDARKALQLAADSTLELGTVRLVPAADNTCRLAADSERAVVFRKKTDRLVLRQEVLAVVGRNLTLHRLADETRTTVDFGDQVVEVVWNAPEKKPLGR